MTRPDPAPLPIGFKITLDPTTKWLDRKTLFGGVPPRVLKLSDAGLTALARLENEPVSDATTGALGRRLTDAGLAHPLPPKPNSPAITVVIPTRDRASQLDRLLPALITDAPVIVVDDASHDSASVAEVAHRHGARLIVRPVNGGPGPARNSGLSAVDTDLVAFIDTDCVPSPDWLTGLAAHLADPMVVAAAPRIMPLTTGTPAERYAASRGALDLGPDEARVAALSRVSYVPTAAIVFRRSALGPTPFDEALRYGEDVDLVWRLVADGGRIRYVPSVVVRHAEPESWPRLLQRRFRYGTSAAPLSRRHPQRTAALVLSPWPAATVGALLAGRPVLATLAFAGSAVGTRSALQRVDVPTAGVVPASARAVRQSWLNLADYSAQAALPLLVAAARRRRRAPLLALLITPGLRAWWNGDRSLNPVTMIAAVLVDHCAYGLGVWRGCLRERTLRPWRPFVVRRVLPATTRNAVRRYAGSASRPTSGEPARLE